MSKKITIEDIFNDDKFGLLDSKPKTSNIKTEDDRLIDSFEEINSFVDNNNREPGLCCMSEYNLSARLKTFRENESKKKTLKPFDRHNLLGHVEMEIQSIDDILNDKDDFGLLDTDDDLSVFKFNHTPNPIEKAKTEEVAKRKPLKEKEFSPYEKIFLKVHKEIKEGKRKIKEFKNVEEHLGKDRFYILDGILLYLENVVFDRSGENLGRNTLRRKDGRTRIIFENATISNMLYRSLGKALYNNGKMVTEKSDLYNQDLFVTESLVKEEDIQTGWIYVLKSISTDSQIASIKDLYKIGFTNTHVEERIKNAKNEATYLYNDVKIVSTYAIYNRNADKLEQLLHRFFADSCLNIDLFDEKGQRITPREWFVVPFKVIEEAIELILNESIINYKYDSTRQKIVFNEE